MRVIRWILLTLLGLVLALTVASVAYNASTSDPELPVQSLWHGKTVEGTAYREWGSGGPPVVLVGGFLEPSFIWEKVGPLLSLGFHVYALDLDGFGYTVRRGPWTLDHWGDQVQAFCRALGIRRPIVVGHSLGAAVAVEEARRGVASAIVLVDGDAVRGGGPPAFLRTALVHSPFFTTTYRLLLRSPWAVRRIIENGYGSKRPKVDDAEIRRWTDQFRARGARQALQSMADHEIAGFTRAQLRRVHVRSVVLWGSADSVDPVESGRQTARDLGARFVLIHDAGHLSTLVAAAQIAAAIALR